MKTIFLLNGPPHCGKDTLADLVCATFPHVHKLSFKTILFQETADYYEVSLDEFLEGYEQNKDVPWPALNNLTKRQALIHVSENIIKPTKGKTYLGRALASQIAIHPGTHFIIPDSGFVEELIPLTKGNKINLISILRDGCDFTKDSRAYLVPNEQYAKLIPKLTPAKIVPENLLWFYTVLHNNKTPEYLLHNFTNVFSADLAEPAGKENE